MGGCTNCRCRDMGDDKMQDTDSCAIPGENLGVDEEGLCPCGKELSECCHKDEILEKMNEESAE